MKPLIIPSPLTFRPAAIASPGVATTARPSTSLEARRMVRAKAEDKRAGH